MATLPLLPTLPTCTVTGVSGSSSSQDRRREMKPCSAAAAGVAGKVKVRLTCTRGAVMGEAEGVVEGVRDWDCARGMGVPLAVGELVGEARLEEVSLG